MAKEKWAAQDIEEEAKIGAAEELTQLFKMGFKDTTVESVLGRMKYKEKCKIFRGCFPETAAGVEDVFCFVSLDTDLYRPTKEGLAYFWPKLQGGYIFVHDYNSPACRGVHRAVDEFCRENDIRVVPICDKYGSCILVK